MTPTEMVKEFRKACKAPQVDVNDKDAMVRKMNLFIKKFEEFYLDAGFGFDKQGDPKLIQKGNPAKIFKGLISMAYVIIDWSQSYGWDFDKGFEKVHYTNMAKIHPNQGLKVNSAGEQVGPDVLEPGALNNLKEKNK